MNGDHVDRHHVAAATTTSEDEVLGAVAAHVLFIAILLGDGEVHAGLDEAWWDHRGVVIIGYCDPLLAVSN